MVSTIYPTFYAKDRGSIPDPPILEECAKGICLCIIQPNDRETVIEG